MIKATYWKIDQLPGISVKDQKQLRILGINNTQDLLKQTPTLDHQQSLANQLKISVRYVKKWVAMASLAQIPSVGCRYCGLLIHCSILSISQLASTPLPTLQRQIQKLYLVTQQKREEQPPTGMIQTWLKEARILQHSLKTN